MGEGTVLSGITSVGGKAVMVMATPAFGLAALAGIVGWQLWKAHKDSKEIEAKQAALSTAR